MESKIKQRIIELFKPIEKYKIVFTSQDVIDAISNVKDRSKISNHIFKSIQSNHPVFIEINGKNIKFIRKSQKN